MKFDLLRRDPPKPVVQTRVPINSFTTTPTQRPAKRPRPFIYSRVPSGVVKLPLRDQDKPGQLLEILKKVLDNAFSPPAII